MKTSYVSLYIILGFTTWFSALCDVDTRCVVEAYVIYVHACQPYNNIRMMY
jgi:hypothetical protein